MPMVHKSRQGLGDPLSPNSARDRAGLLFMRDHGRGDVLLPGFESLPIERFGQGLGQLRRPSATARPRQVARPSVPARPRPVSMYRTPSIVAPGAGRRGFQPVLPPAVAAHHRTTDKIAAHVAEIRRLVRIEQAGEAIIAEGKAGEGWGEGWAEEISGLSGIVSIPDMTKRSAFLRRQNRGVGIAIPVALTRAVTASMPLAIRQPAIERLPASGAVRRRPMRITAIVGRAGRGVVRGAGSSRG